MDYVVRCRAFRSTLVIAYILDSTQTRGRFSRLVGLPTKAVENDSEPQTARRLRREFSKRGRNAGFLVGKANRSEHHKAAARAGQMRTYKRRGLARSEARSEIGTARTEPGRTRRAAQAKQRNRNEGFRFGFAAIELAHGIGANAPERLLVGFRFLAFAVSALVRRADEAALDEYVRTFLDRRGDVLG